MVNLPLIPGVGNRYGQHDAVLTPTLGEPLQGDPVRDTHYPEVDQRRQMAPGVRRYFLRGCLLTWFQGPLQTYARSPPPHGSKKGWFWLGASTRPLQTSRGLSSSLSNSQQDCMSSCRSSLIYTAITTPRGICVEGN